MLFAFDEILSNAARAKAIHTNNMVRGIRARTSVGEMTHAGQWYALRTCLEFKSGIVKRSFKVCRPTRRQSAR